MEASALTWTLVYILQFGDGRGGLFETNYLFNSYEKCRYAVEAIDDISVSNDALGDRIGYRPFTHWKDNDKHLDTGDGRSARRDYPYAKCVPVNPKKYSHKLEK